MNLNNMDGRIEGDALIIGDPHKGSIKVVKAIMVAFANLENAPIALLNQVGHEMQSTLHNALKPGMSMQVIFRSYANLQQELNNIYENSRNLPTNEWSMQQRDFHFVRFSRLMRRGYLRSTGAEMYLSQTVETSGNSELDAERIEAAKKSLDLSLSEMIGGFERAGGDACVMQQADLQGALWQHFNPGKPGSKLSQPVPFDANKSILQNCLLNDVETPKKPKGHLSYNGLCHGFVGLDRLPQMTTSGFILPLCSLPFNNYKLILQIESIDPQTVVAKEEREIARMERARSTSKQASLTAPIETKYNRIHRLMGGDVRPFHIQLYAHVWEPTEAGLQQKLERVRVTFKMLQGANGSVVELPTSCRNAFFACMPGSPEVTPVFRHYTECINLAHLLPIAGNSVHRNQSAEAFFNGNNHSLHGVNLFMNGSPLHSVVCGKTGSGKSCFQIELLTQTQPHWDKLIIIDVGLSYATYVKTFPGKVKTLVLEAFGSETFNYLSTHGKVLKPEHYRRAAKIVSLMAGQFAVEQNYRDKLIVRYVRNFYLDWGTQWAAKSPKGKRVSYTDAYAHMDEDDQPTHADFHDWLKNHVENESHFPDDLLKLILLLEGWRKDCGGYTLFDGKGTVSFDADVIHLELSKISDVDDELKRVASFVIAELIRSQIIGMPRNLRKVVVFEELGAFLQIPGGKATLRDFMERMRRYNTCVISTIQQVSLLPEDLATSILGNSGQAFLFAQKYEGEARFLQRAFQLPESAVQRLMQFGSPTAEHGAPFLHCIFSDTTRRVVTAASIASPEMLYAASSSGDDFEAREVTLAGYDDINEGIHIEAGKKFQ